MVESGAQVRIGVGCVVAALGSFAASPACGGGEPGVIPYEPIAIAPAEQALCHKLIECGCGEAFAQLGLVAPLSCEGWTLADAFAEADDGYEYYGYGYEGGDYDDPLPVAVDDACLESLARRIDALECDMYFSAFPDDCRDFCWPLVGPRHAGEPCDDQIECSRGLRCAFGECREPCLVAAPGEGASCESRHDCERDTQVCTAELDGGVGLCVGLPGPGSGCYYGECLPGARCDDGRCVELTAEGAACTGHRQCASGYCPAGFCERRPGPGEACGIDGACAPGTSCLPSSDGEGGTCTGGVQQCTALFETFAELLFL